MTTDDAARDEAAQALEGADPDKPTTSQLVVVFTAPATVVTVVVCMTVFFMAASDKATTTTVGLVMVSLAAGLLAGFTAERLWTGRSLDLGPKLLVVIVGAALVGFGLGAGTVGNADQCEVSR